MSYTVMSDEILKEFDSKIYFAVTKIRNDRKRAERRTDVSCIIVLISVFLSSLLVTKPRFITKDGFSVTFNISDVYDELKESYTISYLHVLKPRIKYTSTSYIKRRSWLVILCLLCGDVPVNPGPVNLPNSVELNNILNQRGNHVFHQNIRGLFSKKPHLEVLFQRYKKVDIFTLSETHVDKSDVESLYKIPGFTFENRPRLSGDGGGVAAYISNNIKWERREDLENKNI